MRRFYLIVVVLSLVVAFSALPTLAGIVKEGVSFSQYAFIAPTPRGEYIVTTLGPNDGDGGGG